MATKDAQSGKNAGSTRTYENTQNGQREDLDPNSAETMARIQSGELREVPDGKR